MDLGSYADRAVALANAELEDLHDAKVLLREQVSDWYARRATETDLGPLRDARDRLRRVFADAAAGRDKRAVDGLNALLAAYPVVPRVSGHQEQDWHLHVSGPAGERMADELVTSACYGLAVALTELGVRRLGVCADPDCGDAFLARNGGRPRQWCSDRCASRANVKAYRERQRAARDVRATG